MESTRSCHRRKWVRPDRKRGRGSQQVVRVEHVPSAGQAIVGSRNLALAHACPRCGARTRASLPCKGPAMPNGRCRMHGGTKHRPPNAGGAGAYPQGPHGAWRLQCRDAGAAQADAGAGRGAASRVGVG